MTTVALREWEGMVRVQGWRNYGAVANCGKVE